MIYENTRKNVFTSQQSYLYMRVTDILEFYKASFIHIAKVCFVYKKQLISLYSSLYA